MGLILKGGKFLLVGGKFATSLACCCTCLSDGDCVAPDGHFAVCCNGVCKNSRDDTGLCTRPDGTTYTTTYDECGREDQSNLFSLCPCDTPDRVVPAVTPEQGEWCQQCIDSGGTCCPDGCCPEPNWVCCADLTVFCAQTACDCPSIGNPGAGNPLP